MNAIQQYKHIQRQIKRLPLPLRIVQDATKFIKHQFRTRPPSLTTIPKSFQQLLDDILIEEAYRTQLPKLLDIIYKHKRNHWIDKLQCTSSMRLKQFWPQVDMVDEVVTNDKHKRDYLEQLESYTSDHFLINEFLDNPRNNGSTIQMKRKYSEQENEAKALVTEVEKLYSFICNNKAKFGIKPPILDVLHIPTVYGLPVASYFRDKLINTKIKQVKRTLNDHRPINEQDIANVCQLIQQQTAINPNYYKYLHKKRKQEQTTLDSIIINDIRKAIVDPIDEDFYLILREWASKQFCLGNDNKYHLYVDNFYNLNPLITQ